MSVKKRRLYPRWYTHPIDEAPTFKTTIPAQLLTVNWLVEDLVGTVYVADIGTGGVGFLAHKGLSIPERFRLEMRGVPELDNLNCVLMNSRPHNGLFNFYGAAWELANRVNLDPLINKWRRLFVSNEEQYHMFPADV